jgi:hypothetical protein
MRKEGVTGRWRYFCGIRWNIVRERVRVAGGVLESVQRGPVITGWRFVRGTNSGTYVRDPFGTDEPPESYG